MLITCTQCPRPPVYWSTNCFRHIPDAEKEKWRTDVLHDVYYYGGIGVPLQECDFGGMDFKKANLSRSNLSRAVLKGANLQECVFIEADLTGADLSGADLFKANFSETKLDETDFARRAARAGELRGLGHEGREARGRQPQARVLPRRARRRARTSGIPTSPTRCSARPT